MSWTSLADLQTGDENAAIGLVGAPLGLGSVTPGRCDLAPAAIRAALRRTATYNLDSGLDLAVRIFDHEDLDVSTMMPGEAFEAIRAGVAAGVEQHELTLLLGGNNAVTRPAAHGLGVPLEHVGLITLDAHFDMRSTEGGPANGNPVRCLLEDGMPGANICQIGLQPFANSEAMHRDAVAAGNGIFSLAYCRAMGIENVIGEALARLAHVEALLVDLDIDVVDRGQCPGAPGARPGGMDAMMAYSAARLLAADPKVKLVDLTEFDPPLDVSDITALLAARMIGEVLTGFEARTSTGSFSPPAQGPSG